ncbi:protein NUCLEAR FUSION DEFECTIVE 4 [Nymphaea colorata]|nr:protein NUCLEAR FUSION DEFECTIVE 4 [Nymphaea colorata]
MGSFLQQSRSSRGGSQWRWVALVASIWIQCASGSSYAFGIYSPALKWSQGYDQSTLDTISFFKDVGANVGVLSGLLYSASAPGRPWVVLLAGALQSFLGYFMMWAAVAGLVARPPVPLMCSYMFLAAHAQTFFNTANVVAAVENFPNSRGTVVGLMKGFLGLSGAILIQLYQTMLKGKSSSFLLMLAILTLVIPISLMSFVRISPSSNGDDKEHLNKFSVVALALAGYLMIIIILQNLFSLVLSVRVISLAVLVMVVLTSPLEIARRAVMRDCCSTPQELPDEAVHLLGDAENRNSMKRGHINERLADGKLNLKHDSVRYQRISSVGGLCSSSHENKGLSWGENLNLLEAMQTLDFWLIFLAMSSGMGSGLATVNNMSQIGESLGYGSIEIHTLISLWSIWNFLGRFGAGYVSDYFLRSRGYGRPIFMVITLAAMSVGHGVISSGLPGALYAGSILVGVCYGAQWSLMPTIASEIFGVRHFGTIFNTIAIASPVGSFFLSVKVVGFIYDLEASSSKTCSGAHCFMLSFFIMASVCLIGSVFALTLFFRTRSLYRYVSQECLMNE